MFCGLDKVVGEGAQDLRPLPPPPVPQSPKKVGEGGAFDPDSPSTVSGSGGGREGRAGASGPRTSPHNAGPHALGLDFGSRFVKLIYGRGDGALVRRKVDSLDFYRDFLMKRNERMSIAWDRLKVVAPGSVVVTGYGKNLLREYLPTITEIRANFLGARQQTGLDHFILLEMGGQDTKVLYIKNGRVFDFLTNDRCAAGTGRYLENMARFLKIPLRKFAGLWEDPAEISQTCAIFGETELISHLLEGVTTSRLAAGVNASVANRALALVRRYPCRTLVFTGGVAQNRAVVRLLQEGSHLKVVVPTYPQFIGALGCYLEARQRLKEVMQ